MGEPIFGHVKGHDHALRVPVARNRAAELERHGAVEHFASIAPSPAGEATAGPPRSVQVTTTSLSWAGQAISKVPVGDDRAPYFSELVASSWRTSASVVAACSPTPMRGTETRTRPLNAPMSS